jgi:hypothetical protein
MLLVQDQQLGNSPSIKSLAANAAKVAKDERSKENQ